MRKVKKIYRANSQHWVGDGFLVQPLFSHMGEDKGVDPFLMLDYAAPYKFEPNTAVSKRGVGEHPHKGFETVTIAYQGEVAHRDSTGAGGVIKEGDVQWMTAGSGISHEEFHSEEFSKKGGMFEMIQLWVNLPAKHKNAAPKYQHLSKEKIPVVDLKDGRIRLIAGNLGEIKGAAQTFTEMNVWDIVVNPLRSLEIEVPKSHNLSLVVLRGKASINGESFVQSGQLVTFEQGDGKFTLRAEDEEVKALLLSGVPINEPVVGYGPFVMNSREEIIEAINDFNSGKFGRIAR